MSSQGVTFPFQFHVQLNDHIVLNTIVFDKEGTGDSEWFGSEQSEELQEIIKEIIVKNLFLNPKNKKKEKEEGDLGLINKIENLTFPIEGKKFGKNVDISFRFEESPSRRHHLLLLEAVDRGKELFILDFVLKVWVKKASTKKISALLKNEK